MLGDPQRAAELRPDEIPALLGALERVRAALWAQMVRAAGPVKREADGAGGHDLLTVPEVAAELRFTRGYVYEAVRRGELPAVRKGKYVRLRRGDLAAWLGDRERPALTGPDASRIVQSLDAAARRPTQNQNARGGNGLV